MSRNTPGVAYASTSSYQQPTESATSAADGQTASTSGNVDVLQKQVNEVVDIMRVNVTKVLERDEKLSELDARAEGLADGSRQFQQTAARVKRKYWWQNCKMWLILIGVVIVIVIIIIVAVVTSINFNSGSSSSGSAATTVKPSNP